MTGPRTSRSGLARRDTDTIILAPWRTNCQVNHRLLRALPQTAWGQTIPGMPRRTVRSLAAHLHNARSRWLKVLGAPLGIPRPPLVNLRTVTRADVLAALRGSDAAMTELLRRGLANSSRDAARGALTVPQGATTFRTPWYTALTIITISTAPPGRGGSCARSLDAFRFIRPVNRRAFFISATT